MFHIHPNGRPMFLRAQVRAGAYHNSVLVRFSDCYNKLENGFFQAIVEILPTPTMGAGLDPELVGHVAVMKKIRKEMDAGHALFLSIEGSDFETEINGDFEMASSEQEANADSRVARLSFRMSRPVTI